MANDRPQIEIWYGREQSFGHNGRPQRWVNVLGRVKGPQPLQSLQYILNEGEPGYLSIGPDLRRLAGRGDFNIDLDCRHLKIGENVMQITAIDESGRQATESVVLHYADKTCPLPYTIDWSQMSHIQEAAQVIDGLWSISKRGISPEELGYDRVIGIGDMAWRDYEVTVPITVHGINAACYNYPSVHAGVGIVMRWKGHTNWGRDEWASGQPYFGPSPYGAIGWYCTFHDAGSSLNFFDPDFQRAAEVSRKLALHMPYIFKVRVETQADGTSRYHLKVWPADEPEPAVWDLSAPDTIMALREGSLLLVSHHTAATFGNVNVQPLKN